MKKLILGILFLILLAGTFMILREQIIGARSRIEITRTYVTNVSQTQGELEVAVSNDGRNVVIAVNNLVGNAPFTQNTVFFSNDGGASFQPSSLAARPTTLINRRDPTVTRGGSNKFYYAALQGSNIVLGNSPDSGATFNFVSNTGATCVTDPGAVNCTSDQPHIAADPRQAFMNNLYVVWREIDAFPPAGSANDIETAMIQCSVDGGATWQQPQAIGRGMLVRITIGADGTPYAIFASGRNGAASIFIQRFTPCSSTLSESLQPAFPLDANKRPLMVASFNNVACPMPGLDRCNDGNILSSPTIAVDSANPNNIYVVYADNTAPGNEDIVIAADTNKGNDGFPTSLRRKINVTNVPARRFLPWSCGGDGEVFVAWYDRRSATPSLNDNTEYYIRSVQMVQLKWPDIQKFVIRESNELNLSDGIPDPQCSSGWPLSPRNTEDSKSCSVPQLAGVCTTQSGPCGSTGSCPLGTSCNINNICVPNNCTNSSQCGVGTTCSSGFCIPNTRLSGAGNAPRCDFSSPSCLAGETCSLGRGLPKYGDYNGFACTGGKAYVAWASGTSPGGLSLSNSGINVFFARVNTYRISNSINFCRDHPFLCIDRPKLSNQKIELKCSYSGCWIIEPLPEICKATLNCPDCESNSLCPPIYGMTISGLGDVWGVDIIDIKGKQVQHDQKIKGNILEVTFRPTQDGITKNQMEDYYLIFKMTKTGRAGQIYPVQVSLETEKP